MRAAIVDVLLAATVVGEALCVAGILAGATVYDRLHFAGATTSLPPFLVMVAIWLRQPHWYTNPSLNALFVALTLFGLNGVLTHAVARVVRRREVGDIEL